MVLEKYIIQTGKHVHEDLYFPLIYVVSHPTVFFLVAVAVICALLLAGLISISVRKLKLAHQSALDDKEGLLPEHELPSCTDTA